jgi:hypothetical protein
MPVGACTRIARGEPMIGLSGRTNLRLLRLSMTAECCAWRCGVLPAEDLHCLLRQPKLSSPEMKFRLTRRVALSRCFGLPMVRP